MQEDTDVSRCTVPRHPLSIMVKPVNIRLLFVVQKCSFIQGMLGVGLEGQPPTPSKMWLFLPVYPQTHSVLGQIWLSPSYASQHIYLLLPPRQSSDYDKRDRFSSCSRSRHQAGAGWEMCATSSLKCFYLWGRNKIWSRFFHPTL